MNDRVDLLDQMLHITTDLFLETECSLLLDDLPEAPTTILDIGCGNGAYLAKLKERYPFADCTGVELDRPMYMKAALRNDRGMNLIHGSYEQLDEQTALDLIIARLVILHIENVGEFVKWIYNRLHPLSRVVIIDFDDARFRGNERLPLFLSLYRQARQSLRGRRTFLELPDALKLEFQYGGLAVTGTKRYAVRADSPSKKAALYSYMKLSTEYLLGEPLSAERADELDEWLHDPDADMEIPMFGMSLARSPIEGSGAKEAISS